MGPKHREMAPRLRPALLFQRCRVWRREDFFPAKADKPFFLQVESFDVHEPFDSPEPYASMYGSGADRDRFTLWPPIQDAARQAEFLAQASQEEIAFVRSQYGAKLTMTDHWLGKLFDTLDDKGLWDDTIVIVTTDHGHDLGDRCGFGKQFPHSTATPISRCSSGTRSIRATEVL